MGLGGGVGRPAPNIVRRPAPNEGSGKAVLDDAGDGGWFFHSAFGQGGVGGEDEGDRPAPLGVTFHVPVRLQADRLMDQFKAPFRLADRLDGVGPDVRGAIGPQLHVNAEPLVHQPELLHIAQIKLAAELPQAIPFQIMEEAVIRSAGETGKIELNGKMQALLRRQVFQQVDNFQGGAAGDHGDRFGDFDLVAPHFPGAGKLDLRPVGTAANLGVKDSRDKVTQLRSFIAGELGKRGPRLVEMVEQALAGRLVVEEAIFQPRLLEDHPVMNAGDAAAVGIDPCQDFFVVGLGTAGERGEQVVADGADIEFVQLAAAGRGQEADEFVAGKANFLPQIEVIVLDSCFHKTTGAANRLIEQVLAGDELVIDGVAQMGEIDAAEGTVPVGAVALTAIKGLLGGAQGVAPQAALPGCFQPFAGDHHAGVHVVGFGILHFEVAPKASPHKPLDARPARIVL